MRRAILAAITTLAVSPLLATAASPQGWFLAGNDAASYSMARDSTVSHGTSNSGRLASIQASKGFGTMMQSIDASDYRGKRMRLSAWVKANDVKRWAGVWMRVDGENVQAGSLAFDNMQDRPIKGTQDWTKCDVVLDVANSARGISYGILLDGEGTVWMSDVHFDPVPTSVPTTSRFQAPTKKPQNLDFGH